ncbi:hypothetical protein [Lacipirellula sp.]|uniref:hypothetical protein n=1 Tax=Lacipirellula sp. TaxID=2691419 RepID=UPI003D096600
MTDAESAIRRITQLSSFRDRNANGFCDDELANEFLVVVMESELAAAEPCLGILPESARLAMQKMLIEFASRNYYDDRHAYVRDGRTIEERRLYYRQMQPHYRAVGEKLLELLGRPISVTTPPPSPSAQPQPS